MILQKGSRHSQVTKRKMSIKARARPSNRKGQKMSKEGMDKMRKAGKMFPKGHTPSNKGKKGWTNSGTFKKGHKTSDEIRKKIVDTLREKYPNGRPSPRKGVKLTDEEKRRISEFQSTSEMKEFHRQKRLHQKFPQKDSKIEKALFSGLEKNGIKFEKHKPITGQPDIFIKPNCCIFADGDFWHGWLYQTGRRFDNAKKLNNKFFEKVIRRDSENTETLRKQGYKVLRLWEHEIMEDPEKCLQKIIKIIKEARK